MVWQFFILGSALLKTSFDMVSKKILSKEHSSEALLNILFFSVPLTFVLVPFLSFDFPAEMYLLILLRSILSMSGAVFFYKALRHSDVSVVAPFFNISPVLVMTLGFFILGEVLTPLEIIGVGLLMVGAYLLKNEQVSGNDHMSFMKSKYFKYLLACLVLWAFSVVTNRYLLQNVPLLTAFFLKYLSYASILLFYQGLVHRSLPQNFIDLKRDWKNLVFAALFMLSYELLYDVALSMPSAKVALIVPLFRFYVLAEVFIGGKFLHEANVKKRLSAAVLMLLGIVATVL